MNPRAKPVEWHKQLSKIILKETATNFQEVTVTKFCGTEERDLTGAGLCCASNTGCWCVRPSREANTLRQTTDPHLHKPALKPGQQEDPCVYSRVGYLTESFSPDPRIVWNACRDQMDPNEWKA